MSRKITRRETLLDCLAYQERWMRMASKNRMGIIPLEGLEDEFEERDQKCRILRDMIQALESEPVRNAMANWQKILMEGEKPTTRDLVPG